MIEALHALAAARRAVGNEAGQSTGLGLDALIGVILIALSLGLMIGLTLWSRRSINRTARDGYPSARTVVRTRRRG